MSEAISRLNAEEAETQEPTTEGVVAEDGLPSEKVSEDEPKYSLDGYNEEFIKDGKLFGRWDNPNDMASSYKKMQDEKAQSGREAKEVETEESMAKESMDIQSSVISKLSESGFEPTEEMYVEWEKSGKSRDSLENTAMKLERSTIKIHEMTGGKENTAKIAEWASANLSESQLVAFNSEIGDGVDISASGEFAMRGLLSMYNEQNGTQSKGRVIQGVTAPARTVGYQSKVELNTDLQFLRDNPRDASAQRAYEAKFKVTDMRNIR